MNNNSTKIKENFEKEQKLNEYEINKDEITIIYRIKDKNKLRVFGKHFVENNKNQCKILYDNKEYDLNEYFNIDNIKYTDDLFEIKLKGINNITDMSNMLFHCQSLLSVPDLDKINTNKIHNMSSLFDVCLSLLSLPDISNWNTSNVINFSALFHNCL